jgi:hypothetical protein
MQASTVAGSLRTDSTPSAPTRPSPTQPTSSTPRLLALLAPDSSFGSSPLPRNHLRTELAAVLRLNRESLSVSCHGSHAHFQGVRAEEGKCRVHSPFAGSLLSRIVAIIAGMQRTTPREEAALSAAIGCRFQTALQCNRHGSAGQRERLQPEATLKLRPQAVVLPLVVHHIPRGRVDGHHAHQH